MRFTKMHGLGNDYIYVNCFEEDIEDPVSLAVELSDRHFSIGADGLILICPSEIADCKMRIFNADGSEAEMCGNGIRCVAKYVYEHGIAAGSAPFSVPDHESFESSLRIETIRGVLTIGLAIDGDDKVSKVCVNMGQPILKPEDIPVKLSGEQVVNVDIEIDSEHLTMTCVSMGNPHVVFFCEDLNSVELEKIGPVIENHELFPERTNVHFVKIETPNEITVRTWERGSGITLACGTGACACCVAASLTGHCQREITAHLPGGELELNWSQADNCVYMTGPATEVFTGEVDIKSM